tara:strand:+ start:196576 stop:198396 length:1821 start_codon:yes stop_codon:yes gene_type:complete
MGRIRKLFELINGKLPSHNSAFVKTRGIAHPLDPFLSGRLRFARRVGSPLPIWLPENQTTLSSAVSAETSRLPLSESISWIDVGSKIKLDDKVFVFVDDILDDGDTLLLSEPLITGYPSETEVRLYGHPLELNGTFSPDPDGAAIADKFVRDLDPKESCRVLADSNQSLVGEPTVDGVVLSAGDRILLTGQTDPSENGVWEVSVFDWSRPSDFLAGSSASHSHVFILEGASYASSSWVCTNEEGFDTVADSTLVTPVTGDNLTWSRFSSVTTFVVHSDHPIYPGDQINFKFFDYDVVESTPSGFHPDGRITYQITIDVGIPDELEDGRTDQLYLVANPSYESELLPLPKIPLTDSNIGPFLLDRVSGSFFNDLSVEEHDVITVHNASGSPVRRIRQGSKNEFIYNVAIPSDSFLFWDVAQGTVNYSRSRQNFVAYTDHRGQFHAHYICVPELERSPGFDGWSAQVTPEVDTWMNVHLDPNPLRAPFTTRVPGASPPPPPPRGGLFLPAGVTTTVNIDLPEGSEPVKQIHVLFDTGGTPEARVDMKGWEIRGVETAAFVSHATIARVSGRNVWASGSAFAKPYWLRLTYLQVQSDLYSRFNAGLLAT